MSLDALVEAVGQSLGDARQLYGPAPQDGAFGSTDGLSAGRDGVAQASGAADQHWRGVGGSTYVQAAGNHVEALDSVIGADQGTAPGLDGSADQSRQGRNAMTTVVEDTRNGVAALAPSTDTPAGKQQLVTHLQGQLQRAKTLLQVSEQRNAAMAQMIRNASMGYRGTGMGGGMPGMGGEMPTGMAPGGGAGGMGFPNLAALGLTRNEAGLGAPPGSQGAGPEGPSAHDAVRAALTKLGRPYVWGAKGPNAFDCSGLVHWSYAQAGVTLGTDTYSLINQGAPVAPGSVEEGDMIFPKNSFGEGGRAGPGHVMLAISPTQCIEAQQTGVPVKISPMPSAYVARRPTA
jgi:peptidoglycan DL-endopeptidase CwlO